MFLSKTRIFPFFPLIIVYPLNYYTRGEMISIKNSIEEIIFLIESENEYICNIICLLLIMIINENNDLIFWFKDNYENYLNILKNIAEDSNEDYEYINQFIYIINYNE